jgi:hypothetical protein
MLIMLLEPFTPPGRKSRLGQMAVVAAALAVYSLAFQWNSPPRTLFRGMFAVDNFSVFFQWLLLGLSVLLVGALFLGKRKAQALKTPGV